MACNAGLQRNLPSSGGDCRETSPALMEDVRLCLISAVVHVTLSKSRATSPKQGSFHSASHFSPLKGFFSSLAAYSSRYQQ